MALEFVQILDSHVMDNETWQEIPCQGFETRGCGCCNEFKLFTKANVAQALKETSEFLEQLKQIDTSNLPE